jgi:XTP/dITP diphosphohydrolase
MANPHQIVFASGNAGKAREIRALLGPDVEIVLQTDLGIASIPETGTTFVANALLKARHAAACSGLPALADDSGLEVDALQGAPGVYSARYAGPDATDADNNHKLLLALDAVQGPARTARFRCVLAFVRTADDPAPLIATGSWEGYIARDSVGSGGFGYDPIFIDPASGLCSAQLTPEQKNQRSHRGKALANMRIALRDAGLYQVPG